MFPGEDYGMTGIQRDRIKAANRRSKTLLVPIDFSEASNNALRAAIDLATEPSRIILLHVISPQPNADDDVPSLSRRASRQLLRLAESCLGKQNHRVHTFIRTGSPFQEILSVAAENKVKMIVLGVPDSGPLAGIELGHTIDRVSRYAKCPVLLIRESDAGKSPAKPALAFR